MSGTPFGGCPPRFSRVLGRSRALRRTIEIQWLTRIASPSRSEEKRTKPVNSRPLKWQLNGLSVGRGIWSQDWGCNQLPHDRRDGLRAKRPQARSDRADIAGHG